MTVPQAVDPRHPGIKPSGGLAVAPELGAEDSPRGPLDGRAVTISVIAALVALAVTLTARVLVSLIALVTNVAFFGRWSFAGVEPSQNRLGPWVIVVPALGGIVVGVMARYGSRAIRGHGIPEAMEQVLTNESRIAPKITFLKPASSAIAIGTGGPFGAEGPIIATGGALGSLVGQILHTTGIERKTLLAAGAAAGMTAIFGSPLAAIVLAVELLLFELRPRTLVPVAIACAVAAGTRPLFFPTGAVFPMAAISTPHETTLLAYLGLGLVIGLAATLVTKLVYGIEDAFERLPIHWMWWPALGGLAVGIVGYFMPRTLGVGYQNITDVLNGNLALPALSLLCVLKLTSWSISLGSGTSGGTLAPLLTIGGGLGAALGGMIAQTVPQLGIDPRAAALIGMAGMFAGASRAFLTSVVFALETTQQPTGLLPLIAGCAGAYLVSCLLMENTIMTEKIARRGIRVPSEYVADYLAHVTAGSIGRRPVVTLAAGRQLGEVRAWLRTHRPETEHQGYPVLDAEGRLTGVVTRRNLLDPAVPEETAVSDLVRRAPVVALESESLRDIADSMVRHSIGRLPLVDSAGELVGIVTRSDLLAVHARRLIEHERIEKSIQIRKSLRRVRRRRAAG